jgi:hypothetical protein
MGTIWRTFVKWERVDCAENYFHSQPEEYETNGKGYESLLLMTFSHSCPLVCVLFSVPTANTLFP